MFISSLRYPSLVVRRSRVGPRGGRGTQGCERLFEQPEPGRHDSDNNSCTDDGNNDKGSTDGSKDESKENE